MDYYDYWIDNGNNFFHFIIKLLTLFFLICCLTRDFSKAFFKFVLTYVRILSFCFLILIFLLRVQIYFFLVVVAVIVFIYFRSRFEYLKKTKRVEKLKQVGVQRRLHPRRFVISIVISVGLGTSLKSFIYCTDSSSSRWYRIISWRPCFDRNVVGFLSGTISQIHIYIPPCGGGGGDPKWIIGRWGKKLGILKCQELLPV